MSEGTKIIGGILSQIIAEDILDFYSQVLAFAQPARILLVQNFTDQLLMFSLDGIINSFVLPVNGFLLLDVATNRNTAETSAIPQNYGVYVTAPADLPSVGSVYATYWYAQ